MGCIGLAAAVLVYVLVDLAFSALWPGARSAQPAWARSLSAWWERHVSSRNQSAGRGFEVKPPDEQKPGGPAE